MKIVQLGIGFGIGAAPVGDLNRMKTPDEILETPALLVESYVVPVSLDEISAFLDGYAYSRWPRRA